MTDNGMGPMSAAPQYLPMMAGESVDMAFGEKVGLGADAAKEKAALLLTDRRVIRLSKAKRGLAVTFLSLGDIHGAEVTHRPRSAKRLFRMALLLAGAGAALIAVEWHPLSWALGALLGLGAMHHLYQYISVSQEGSILFRTTQQELSIPYRGRGAEQAYDLVNRFFQLKAMYSPTTDVSSDSRGEREYIERPGKPFRQLWPWGQEGWYETWFLDRSTPIAELRLSDGAKAVEYETWFMERAVPVSDLLPVDEAKAGRTFVQTDNGPTPDGGEVHIPLEDAETAGETRR